MPDVHVYLIDLPNDVHEMVTPDTEDADYTIYINRRLSDHKRLEAYSHAVRHCKKDFERSNVQEVEAEAHGRGKT